MIGFVIAAIGMIVPGALLFVLLRREFDAWDLLGGSIALGAGSFTLFLFLLSVIGVPLKLAILAPIILAVTLLLGLLAGFKRRAQLAALGKRSAYFRNAPRTETAICGVLLLLILAMLAVDVIDCLYWPVHAYDAVIMHHYKAKVFHELKGVAAGPYEIHRSVYPLMIPLTHCWMLECGATEEKLFYPLMLVSLLGVLVSFFRAHRATPAGLLAGVLILTIPLVWEQSSLVYLNLTATVFSSIGFIYFYRWVMKPERDVLLLANLFGALAVWTRLEAIMCVGVLWLLSAILALIRKKYKDWGLATLPGLLLTSIWPIYHSFFSSLNPAERGGVPIDPGRALEGERWSLLWEHAQAHLADVQTFGGVWWLLGVGLVLGIARWNRLNGVQVPAILILAFGIGFSTLISDYPETTWDLMLKLGIRRQLLYLVPLGVILLASQWLPRRGMGEVTKDLPGSGIESCE